jgi:SCY1-like protein 1
MRDDYFALGLRQIATAVSFLSNDCALVHGGVSAAAVVVTDRLDWKLSGFDLVSELASVGRRRGLFRNTVVS